MAKAAFSMVCYDQSNFQHMANLLTRWTPARYTLCSLTSSRTKGSFNGCCTWTAFYEILHDVVNGKRGFDAAVKELTAKLPIGASVVAKGRCFGPTNGIVITLGNNCCLCPKDFVGFLAILFLKVQKSFLGLKSFSNVNHLFTDRSHDKEDIVKKVVASKLFNTFFPSDSDLDEDDLEDVS